MKHLLNPSFILATALLATACAKINTSTVKLNASSINSRGGGLSLAQVSPSTLNGNWTSTCAYDNTTGAYYTATIQFQGETMITTSTKFLDQACATAQYKETRTSAFTVATQAANETTTDISETLSSVNFDVLTQGMVTLFNQGSYCGVSNWALNASQTFLNTSTASAAQSCENLPLAQTFHSQLYGSTELYLDNCATPTSTNCSTIEYTRSN